MTPLSNPLDGFREKADHRLMDTPALITILQASIAPFVLISGIGLLLLSLTNRIARPTDLIRRLLPEIETAETTDKRLLINQVDLLRRRCSLLRTSIFLSCMAIACVSMVTLLLYASLLFNVRLHLLVEFLFGSSLACLVGSLFYLALDIRITLRSLDMEIERHRN